MITAQHRAWAHSLFRPYLRWLSKRRFHTLSLLGERPNIPATVPILLLPNHATWWDGFFPYLLNDAVFKRQYFIMMLEHRLKEFWFFRFLGAFSINQQSPKSIIESLSYTSSLLTSEQGQPRTPLVVMFPQGELRPFEIRPLGYNRGVERVLKNIQGEYAIVPLAMRCEFLGEEKPYLFLECGTPHIIPPFDKRANTMLPTAQQLEQEMELLLERLKNRIVAGERGQAIL